MVALKSPILFPLVALAVIAGLLLLASSAAQDSKSSFAVLVVEERFDFVEERKRAQKSGRLVKFVGSVVIAVALVAETAAYETLFGVAIVVIAKLCFEVETSGRFVVIAKVKIVAITT